MTNTTKLLNSFDRIARRVSTLVPALPDPVTVSRNHCFLPLIQRMVQARRELNHATITAFTSVAKGDGVTHTVECLAWELAKYSGQQVLLTTGGGLATPPVQLPWEDDARVQHPVHRLLEVHGSGQRTMQNIRWQDLGGLRQRFGFVLVDCPSMQESSVVLHIGRMSDNVVLVVAEGESDLREVRIAHQVLAAGSTNVLGLVLNKRTNPIPNFISRFF